MENIPNLNCEIHELHLFDAESNRVHTILVNSNDYTRALHDDTFATSLLHNNVVNTSENNSNLEIETERSEIESVNVTADYEEKENKTTTWQYNETKALINSVYSHFDELDHPRKRKFVFQNVSNDLLSQNIIKTDVQCQIKWKSLVRSYKNFKDGAKRTGRGPTRFLFYEEMDEILGSKPSISCSHVLDSSVNETETSGSTVVERDENTFIETTVETGSTVETNKINTQFRKENCEENPSTLEQPSKKRKTKPLTERYLLLKKDEYENRQLRHKERLEVEKKKLSLLEKYLEKQNS